MHAYDACLLAGDAGDMSAAQCHWWCLLEIESNCSRSQIHLGGHAALVTVSILNTIPEPQQPHRFITQAGRALQYLPKGGLIPQHPLSLPLAAFSEVSHQVHGHLCYPHCSKGLWSFNCPWQASRHT